MHYPFWNRNFSFPLGMITPMGPFHSTSSMIQPLSPHGHPPAPSVQLNRLVTHPSPSSFNHLGQPHSPINWQSTRRPPLAHVSHTQSLRPYSVTSPDFNRILSQIHRKSLHRHYYCPHLQPTKLSCRQHIILTIHLINPNSFAPYRINRTYTMSPHHLRD
jgi:hypothetical protein